MRIPGKIMLIVCVMWIALVSLAGVSIFAFEKSLHASLSASAAREQVQSIQIIQNAVVTSGLSLHRYMQASTWEQRAQHAASTLKSLEDIDVGLKGVDAASMAEQAGWNTVRDLVSTYRQQAGMTVALLRAKALPAGDIEPPPIDELLIVLRAYVHQMLEVAEDRSAEHLIDQQKFQEALVAILVIGLLASLVVASAIGVDGIVRPIRTVTHALNRLAVGDTSVELPEARGRTEIADLWRTAHAFRSTWERLQAESAEIVESRRRLEASLRRDFLTGLGNRLRFNEELIEASRRSVEEGHSFGLLLIDLDRFKLINDTLGHAAGDGFLKEIARRLDAAAPAGATTLRLGGDEFAVIVGPETAERLDEVAEDLLAGMVVPMEIGQHRIVPSISIGGALYPTHAEDIAALVLAADRCLYLSKGGTVKIHLFEASMKADLEYDQTILAEIRTALPAEQFVVHYQPQVTAASYSHAGLEALVRWNHPTRGLLAPGAFLSIAERTGLMVDITRAVLGTVARDIRAWKAAGLDFGRVAVNIPEEIIGSDFGADLLDRAIEGGGIRWDDLTVEVTENVFIARNPQIILTNLERMSDRGARIALDDFGTGFASLTHLRRLAFDELKIDRSFTADLGRDPRANQIVRSMIDLGRRLGKTIVAEGVETREQAASLMADGCNVLQGYLFARPLPPEAATAWLADQRSRQVRVADDRSADAARAAGAQPRPR